MPSTTEKQRRFMAMQLSMKRAGKKTDVNMTEAQLRDFAKKRKKQRLADGLRKRTKRGQ